MPSIIQTGTSPLRYNIITTGFPSGFPSQNIATFISTDGITFTTPPGVTNPVGTFLMNGGTQGTVDTEAMESIYFPGSQYSFWLCYEQVGGAPFSAFSQLTFGIMGAKNPYGPWNWVADVQIFNSTIGNFSTIWDPHWFNDDNGDWYVVVNAGNNQTFVGSALSAMLVKCNNPGTFTSWGAPTTLTVTGFGNVLDATIVSSGKSPLGSYTMFFKDNLGTNKIGYATSSTLTGTYTVVGGKAPSDDPLGFGAAENFHLIQLSDRWRAYASANGAEPAWATDSLDNWTTWGALQTCSSPYTGTGGSRVYNPNNFHPNNKGP